MVLSTLLVPKLTPGGRKSRRGTSWTSSSSSIEETSSKTQPQDDGYIRHESMLGDAEPANAELSSLNGSLEALAAIFPDVQAEVFREMLSSYSEESRLHVVTEALLKHKAKWVRGRWRVSGKERPRNHLPMGEGALDASSTITLDERFRSSQYKKAVRSTLYQEFRGLSHATVNAVLAEHNFSYSRSRPTLQVLASKSWRSAISSFFMRRKTPAAALPANHPLVAWRPGDSPDEPAMPMLKSTESPELNRELFDALIRPVLEKVKTAQETRDYQLAMQVNEEEAEEIDMLYDCECCFTSTTFEQLSACDAGGHFICFRCLRHTVNEAVFGQGWSRNMDPEKGTVRCIAPAPTGSEDCQGRIPQHVVRRALIEEKGSEDVWHKVEERLASDGLYKSQAPLVRCPFCAYAEVDDFYLPAEERTWRIKRSGLFSVTPLLILIFGTGMLPFLFPFVLVIFIATFLHLTSSSLPTQLSEQFDLALTRLARRQRGLRFTCQAPSCRRSSCLACAKEWRDIHICYESERLALRAHVERAMSAAVKRTCPRCNLSFVKASGCNKLTCVCGYNMCYVCRGEIGDEGYRHFCEHFRPKGAGACEVCDKCDLYRAEDEEQVVRLAGDAAEREWRARESGAALDEWRWDTRDDFARGRGAGLARQDGRRARVVGWRDSLLDFQRHGGWAQVLDWLLEQVIELA